jgi:FAD binding domain
MRKLLTPHVRAIGRPAGPAQHDAVDPAGVEGTLAALKNDLIRLVGQDQVLHRVSDLIRHATFRAGGTSMNGQSQSDDILIDVRRHWGGMVVEDGGARLRARPGTILGQANTIPAPANTTVSWIVLPSIGEAAVPGLVAQGAEAAELMIAPALAAAAQAFPGTPQYWRSLDPAAAASALGGPLLAVVSET